MNTRRNGRRSRRSGICARRRSRRDIGSRTSRRAPRSCSPAAATRPSARWACSARCSSAASPPTSSSGRRPARGTARCSPPTRRSRRRSPGRDVGAAPRRRHLPRREAHAGVEPAHPRRPPLLRRGPARGGGARGHARHVRGARGAAAGDRVPTSRPARRSCSPAGRCARRCWPPPRCRACSRRCASTAARSSTARSSTPCRSRTRSPGRSTGSTCSTCRASSCAGPTGRRSTCW